MSLEKNNNSEFEFKEGWYKNLPENKVYEEIEINGEKWNFDKVIKYVQQSINGLQKAIDDAKIMREVAEKGGIEIGINKEIARFLPRGDIELVLLSLRSDIHGLGQGINTQTRLEGKIVNMNDPENPFLRDINS